MAKSPIGPVEALRIALDKERNAVELYRELGVGAKGASEIFDFLINEEMKHVRLIEMKIKELTKE